MTQDEAKTLVDKCMRVIISCKTDEQLDIAIKYASFAYNRLSKGVGLINNTSFISLIERSIGYSQCKIKRGGCYETGRYLQI